MTGKVSESLQGTSQLVADGFGCQQGLMLPVLPRLAVGRRSQIPLGAVVSTARPGHLPLAAPSHPGAHIPELGWPQVWSWPGLPGGLWNSSHQPWADPWLEMLLTPCHVLGASLLQGGRWLWLPWVPAVSCVSQGLWALSASHWCLRVPPQDPLEQYGISEEARFQLGAHRQ